MYDIYNIVYLQYKVNMSTEKRNIRMLKIKHLYIYIKDRKHYFVVYFTCIFENKLFKCVYHRDKIAHL